MAILVFVVMGLICTDVGLVSSAAGHALRSPSLGHQHFIHKCTDQ